MSGLNVFTSGKRLVNIARDQLHDRTRSFDSTGRPIAVASRERGGETLTKLSAQLSEATTARRTNSSIKRGDDDDNAMDGSVMGCHTRCFLPHRSTRKHGPSISSSPPRPAQVVVVARKREQTSTAKKKKQPTVEPNKCNNRIRIS
jgi:hypothetical protein